MEGLQDGKMAHLLVNQTCMESLRKDITDLQGTIISVFSRVGAVRFPSWKFPDKVSCDLDLVALLERYDFAENDPEFTHHSHVVLLELVIDRLLLLLQSFTGYTENLISEQVVPPYRGTGPSMSIGLAVTKYWDNMLKLGALYQQLTAEKRPSKEETSSPKRSLQAVKSENEPSKRCSSECSESCVTLPSFRSSPLTLSAISGPLRNQLRVSLDEKSAGGANQGSRSIHSQTIESCPEPCDACRKVQDSLREVGDAVISLCNGQNLPSSLSRFLEMVEEKLNQKSLTAVDLSYWASEQSKDLSRINKHLQTLVESINPLKKELMESEKEKDKLKKQLETFENRLQEEKEKQKQQKKEMGLLFEKKNAESLQLVAVLKKDKEDLHNKEDKSHLLLERDLKMVDKEEMIKLEDQVRTLAHQLEVANQHLNWATMELDKEKAKVESVLRHKESLQAKQRALMQQLDDLDQQCEQLKASLAEAEDAQFVMKENLKELQQEKWELHRHLEEQQKLTERVEQEKRTLELSASELGELIQEFKEREQLLVSFPDLHIPVEAKIESTGDVLEDMGKQLQANNIRISVLEEENVRLRIAVAKMKQAMQQETPKIVSPTQLWVQTVANHAYEDDRMLLPTEQSVFLEAEARSPNKPISIGSAARSRSQHGSRDDPPSRRSSSRQRPKPFSEEAVQKAVFTFSCEDAAVSAYARVKGRGRGLGPLARCARNQQK
uniref:Coiled-coil domain containing 157 n=1 Tax=Salvator merianae TaxID=96440 RepID=A0A8D0KJB6_SALMN